MLGKIPPGGSSFGDPKDSIDEKTVVFGSPSVLSGPAWQHIFDTIPALIANFMTTHQINSIRRSGSEVTHSLPNPPNACPHDLDQTNREGLRDNPTERQFREFLIRIIQELFVKILDKFITDEGSTDEQLIARGVNLQQDVETAVDNLLNAADEGRLDRIREAHLEVKRVLETVPALAGDLKDSIQNQVLGRIEVLELSATGMTAASIAHDLEAALDQAIVETGGMAKIATLAPRQRESLVHLTGLFKSLRTLVEDIKPGPAKTRRRKTTFALPQLLEHLNSFYNTQFEKHGITVAIHDARSVKVKAVEGHVRQIFDNLFRNSIYWISDTIEKHPEEAKDARIEIEFDHASKTLAFKDSGVGIALHDAEWIFRPFSTHKKQGTGLGLYIAKEFCEFNGIKIAVDTSTLNKWRRCPQFILDLSACYVE